MQLTEESKPAPSKMIRVDIIHRNERQPRSSRDQEKLNRLAQSVAVHGVEQDVEVRPHPAIDGEYELVFGEGRWLAAQMAGLEEIPAKVRKLDDRTQLERALDENLNREDMHPLDEGEGYRRLHDEFGVTVEDIADRYGLSPATVAQRIALTNLVPEAKKDLRDGKVSMAAAIHIARVPALLQGALLEELKEDHDAYDGDAITEHETRDLIRSRYMLKLVDAPFNIEDDELVAKAGSCNDCPKRTKNDLNLFNDVTDGDFCTDPECFGEKLDVWWQRASAEAEAAGKRVLSAAETEQVIKSGHVEYNAAFVDLNSRCNSDSKFRTYRELLKEVPQVVLARQGAHVFELVARKDLPDLLEKHGVTKNKKELAKAEKKRQTPAGKEKRKIDPKAAAKREETRVQNLAQRLAMGELVDRHLMNIGIGALHAPTIQVAAKEMVELASNDIVRGVAKRRGLPDDYKSVEKLKRSVKDMDGTAALALILEIIFMRGVVWAGAGDGPLQAALKLAEISFSEAKKAARAMPRAGGKKPAAAAESEPTNEDDAEPEEEEPTEEEPT